MNALHTLSLILPTPPKGTHVVLLLLKEQIWDSDRHHQTTSGYRELTICQSLPEAEGVRSSSRLPETKDRFRQQKWKQSRQSTMKPHSADCLALRPARLSERFMEEV